ncbi:AAA family ATPase [Streptomyces sp. NPDC017529]|uniref:AAA family ATPase n=1 Tax=Streptomyces sp. NPDC017529 TaxID=3365000 RepID=UPI00378F07DE
MSAGAQGPPLPGLAGRAAEYGALRGLLARSPLVTVTGPANVGKSTLVRAVLEEAARGDGGPGGGFVRVGCREELDGDGVAAALNRAAGLPYGTSPQALAAHCARRALTVLLDDCDPVAGACAWLVRQLLRAEAGTARGPGRSQAAGPGPYAPAGLRIVATARQPLGIGAERVVPLKPFPALPAEPYGPARGLADRPPGPPPAFAPCSPADRLVWARLSVLPGDFDAWLAGCVGSCSDVSAPAVEATLERLHRASVLERVPADTTGAGCAAARPLSPARYRLPPAARAVGLAGARATGEEATVLRAFRMACAALAAEAQIAWQGADRRAAVRLVEAERHHLQAALTRPPQDADDGRTALDIAVSLWFRWALCGRRREGRAHLGRLLRHCADDTAVRARALWLAGWLAAQDDAPRTAESLLVRARHAAARHGDTDTLARIAHARGVLALRRADTGTAVACLRRAAGHRCQDAWYGPGPAYSQALLAIALAAAAQSETRSGSLQGPRCGLGLT